MGLYDFILGRPASTTHRLLFICSGVYYVWLGVAQGARMRSRRPILRSRREEGNGVGCAGIVAATSRHMVSALAAAESGRRAAVASCRARRGALRTTPLSEDRVTVAIICQHSRHHRHSRRATQ